MSASDVDQPRLSRTAPWAIPAQTHRFQHVGRLDLAGGTGRARRYRDPCEIEPDHRGLRLEPGNGEQRGIGQPGTSSEI